VNAVVVPGCPDVFALTRVHGRDAVDSAAVAEVLLFHHAQGQTPGFVAFADELRAAGHTVHTPDLYDGKTFASLEEGVGHAQQVGFGEILERGEQAAADLPSELVYAGFSLGVIPAQKLAQTRPGARGALFFSAALPASEFGGSWPEGVPLQIHMMASDEWALEDLPAARDLVETVDGAELFLYPGDRHLFADGSLADYDEQAAAELKERVLAFLKSVD
jgi:dienelactone hydrolase